MGARLRDLRPQLVGRPLEGGGDALESFGAGAFNGVATKGQIERWFRQSCPFTEGFDASKTKFLPAFSEDIKVFLTTC